MNIARRMLDFQRNRHWITEKASKSKAPRIRRCWTSLFVDGSVSFSRDDTFFPTGSEDSDQDVGFILNGGTDLATNIIVGALKILPGVTGVVHHGEEVVLHADELVVLTLHVGHFHVVGGWADIFKFLASEDVEGDHVDLGVAVLTSLGGRHLNNLAWPVLDHNESSLTQSRALHGEGGRSPRIPLVEIKIIGHFRLVKRDDLL